MRKRIERLKRETERQRYLRDRDREIFETETERYLRERQRQRDI